MGRLKAAPPVRHLLPVAAATRRSRGVCLPCGPAPMSTCAGGVREEFVEGQRQGGKGEGRWGSQRGRVGTVKASHALHLEISDDNPNQETGRTSGKEASAHRQDASRKGARPAPCTTRVEIERSMIWSGGATRECVPSVCRCYGQVLPAGTGLSWSSGLLRTSLDSPGTSPIADLEVPGSARCVKPARRVAALWQPSAPQPAICAHWGWGSPTVVSAPLQRQDQAPRYAQHAPDAPPAPAVAAATAAAARCSTGACCCRPTIAPPPPRCSAPHCSPLPTPLDLAILVLAAHGEALD